MKNRAEPTPANTPQNILSTDMTIIATNNRAALIIIEYTIHFVKYLINSKNETDRTIDTNIVHMKTGQ